MNHRLCPVFLVRPPSAALCARTRRGFFVLVSGRRQIGRIDQTNAQLIFGPALEQAPQELLIDSTQDHGCQPVAKLMKLARIGQTVTVGQMGKASPGALIGQKAAEQIA